MIIPLSLDGTLFVQALGPVAITRIGRDVPSLRSQVRAALAVLLIHGGRVVSVDRMIDAIWDGGPQKSADHGLHVIVSSLRNALETGQDDRTEIRHLVSQPPGYRLVLRLGEFDVPVVENLVHRGRTYLAKGEFAVAEEYLVSAESLWRGEPYADFTYSEFAQAEIRRLSEMRMGLVEDRVETQLALGMHHELVPEIESFVTQFPTRERLLCQLMTALSRSGRSADAMRAFTEAREQMRNDFDLPLAATVTALAELIHSSGTVAD